MKLSPVILSINKRSRVFASWSHLIVDRDAQHRLSSVMVDYRSSAEMDIEEGQYDVKNINEASNALAALLKRETLSFEMEDRVGADESDGYEYVMDKTDANAFRMARQLGFYNTRNLLRVLAERTSWKTLERLGFNRFLRPYDAD